MFISWRIRHDYSSGISSISSVIHASVRRNEKLSTIPSLPGYDLKSKYILEYLFWIYFRISKDLTVKSLQYSTVIRSPFPLGVVTWFTQSDSSEYLCREFLRGSIISSNFVDWSVKEPQPRCEIEIVYKHFMAENV